MTTDHLDDDFVSGNSWSRFWQHWLSVFCGASCTLLALALTNNPNQGILRSNNWNWYLIWALVQMAGLPLVAVFVASKDWHSLQFRARLNSVYAYLALEWVLFSAFFVKLQSDESESLFAGLAGLLLLASVVVATIALVVSYWWLLGRSRARRPEELFP